MKCNQQTFKLSASFIAFFLAERVSSIGKDWHRGCLKCAKCKKTLTPGGHAEVTQLEFSYAYSSLKCKALKVVKVKIMCLPFEGDCLSMRNGKNLLSEID